MSRKFRFTVPYSVPVEELHRAYITDDVWRARFAEATTATFELSHPDGEGTIRIHMSEQPDPEVVPGLVRKVLRSDLTFARTDNWRPLTDGRATGDFVVHTGGIDTDVSGTFEMRPTASGSELEVAGRVRVNVPVVGRAIEPIAEQLLHRVIRGEHKFIEEWLHAQAS